MPDRGTKKRGKSWELKGAVLAAGVVERVVSCTMFRRGSEKAYINYRLDNTEGKVTPRLGVNNLGDINRS